MFEESEYLIQVFLYFLCITKDIDMPQQSPEYCLLRSFSLRSFLLSWHTRVALLFARLFIRNQRLLLTLKLIFNFNVVCCLHLKIYSAEISKLLQEVYSQMERQMFDGKLFWFVLNIWVLGQTCLVFTILW